jgi:hypothetical protein
MMRKKRLRRLDVTGELKESCEWWTLLTVETGLNGDSKSTNEFDPSLVGSMGLSCRYKDIFLQPWLL